MRSFIRILMVLFFVFFSISNSKASGGITITSNNEENLENFLKELKTIDLEDRAYLEALKKILGEDHPYIANYYSFIGDTYNNIINYEKALEYHQKALRIRLKILGKNHPDTATSYNAIGRIYYSLGDYQKALEHLQKALNIRKQIYGENHPDTATSLNNIGLVYYSLGDYQKALEHLQKALNIRKQIYGENHPDTATSLNNIGAVYHSLGDYQKALEYFQKALNIFKQTIGENHPIVAKSYNNIGDIYDKLGDYQKALEYYQKALEILKKIKEEYHPIIAILYDNIGGVYYSLGNYEKALKYYQKALDIFKQIYGENHPDTATSLNNIGLVYYSLGDYQKALEYFQKALNIRKQIYRENHPITASSYNGIAGVYYSIGNYQKAFHYSLKASEIYLNSLSSNIYSVSEPSKSKFASLYKDDLLPLFHSGYQFYTSSKNTSAPKSILNVWINFKSFSFDFDNFINTLYITSKDPNTKQELNEFFQLRNQLARLYSNIPINPEEFKIWKNKVKSIQSEINSIKFQLAKKYNFNIKKVSYEDIQNNLNDNEIYIDFAKVGNYYFVITLDNKGNTHMARINAKEVDNTVNEIRNIISSVEDRLSNSNLTDNSRATILENSNTRLKPLFSKLYKLVIEKPLGKIIENKTTLIISPDGALRLIPFEALINPETNEYLIVEKSIKYIPSGKDFIRLDKLKGKNKKKVIVLSADIKNTESVSALTKAFVSAGSKRVISSLWTLSDKNTSELMDRFYRKVSEGKDYETALREAKIEMIKEGKHPYLWSPLLLFGR